MAKITVEEFRNFFKYYNAESHQTKAVDLLYDELECNCSEQLENDSEWIITYRNQLKTKPKPTGKWPLTKSQLAEIMACSPETLPDSLMDDLLHCVELYGISTLSLAYFLGQCGHESAGLRYPVEIHDGSNYEYRDDLGNIYPGDGVMFAGTGWLQCTGRYNHQRFSDFLQKVGQYDPKIMEVGKTYTAEVYPWSISGFWWDDNAMNEFCKLKPPVDEVGARVNGRYLPNGAEDRRVYTRRAFAVLGLPYPGN
jgi:predicted chitinase